MKNVFVAGLMAAMLALGCTSTPATTTTTTTTDTAGADTAKDTGAAGDTATDTTAGTDAATDTAKADGTTTTDVKKDTAPAVVKCDPKDNACLNSCTADSCGTENSDCTKDSKCFGLNSCLGGCDKVELPTDPTAANCYKKCIDTAGPAAATKFYAAQACAGEKCITCKAGDQGCQSSCASLACIDPLFACQADNACGAILNCMTVDKCTTQACLSACIKKFPDGEATFMGFMQCAASNLNACDE